MRHHRSSRLCWCSAQRLCKGAPPHTLHITVNFLLGRLPAPAAGMTGLKRSWWAAFPHSRRAAAA